MIRKCLVVFFSICCLMLPFYAFAESNNIKWSEYGGKIVLWGGQEMKVNNFYCSDYQQKVSALIEGDTSSSPIPLSKLKKVEIVALNDRRASSYSSGGRECSRGTDSVVNITLRDGRKFKAREFSLGFFSAPGGWCKSFSYSKEDFVNSGLKQQRVDFAEIKEIVFD